MLRGKKGSRSEASETGERQLCSSPKRVCAMLRQQETPKAERSSRASKYWQGEDGGGGSSDGGGGGGGGGGGDGGGGGGGCSGHGGGGGGDGDSGGGGGGVGFRR
eukprot:6193194-Pleurochrysis_carterae.AAC.1